MWEYFADHSLDDTQSAMVETFRDKINPVVTKPFPLTFCLLLFKGDHSQKYQKTLKCRIIKWNHSEFPHNPLFTYTSINTFLCSDLGNIVCFLKKGMFKKIQIFNFFSTLPWRAIQDGVENYFQFQCQCLGFRWRHSHAAARKSFRENDEKMCFVF